MTQGAAAFPYLEQWQHRLEISKGNSIAVTFNDTRGADCTSTVRQLYRNVHGFIIMCDITNLASLRNIPAWLAQIEQAADVTAGRQVCVLVNKIETLLLDEAASESAQDGVEIADTALDQLAKLLRKRHPGVKLYEVSVKHGFSVQESIGAFGKGLASSRDLFIRQRFLQTLQRDQSIRYSNASN